MVKTEYFRHKDITVNTRLDHAKSEGDFKGLLNVQCQDSVNQFGTYLKAIQTARQNIDTFEEKEFKVKRFNSKLGEFQKQLPSLYKTSGNTRSNKIMPSMSPTAPFYRTTAPSTSQKSRNKLMATVFTEKSMTSHSKRRVISVYSSSSKRRSGSQVMLK
jgi:hypothetical protein